MKHGWSNEKIAQARDDILKLEDPSHGGFNICYGDGFYARSLVDKYQMSIGELKRIVGHPKIIKKVVWRKKSD